MKKLNLIIFILAFMFTPCVFAGEQSHRKLAEELLLTTQIDKQINDVYQRTKAERKEQMKNMGISEAFQDKEMGILSQQISWEAIKDGYISSYVEVFSEKELRGLIDFYKTPLGKRFVEKMPELTSKITQRMRKQVEQFFPQMKELSTQMFNEMNQKSPSPTPSQSMMNKEMK